MVRNKKKLRSSLLPFVVLLGTSTHSEACTSVSSNYSISANLSGCIDWSAGNLTVNTGKALASSTDGLFTSGVVGTLTNNGQITNSNSDAPAIGVFNNMSGIVNNLNSIIRSRYDWYYTVYFNEGLVPTFENAGTIENTSTSAGGALGLVWNGTSNIGTLHNAPNGIITSVTGNAITAAMGGSIDYINNEGTIRVTGGSVGGVWLNNDNGTAILNSSDINTITNTGSIYTTVSGAFGIMNNNDTSGYYFPNAGSIRTLNNAQGAGNSHGALTYTGNLPTNYNIIINDLTHYGQLSVTGGLGLTTFGVSALSGTNIGVAGTRYQNVLSGLSSDLISNENTLLTYQSGSSIGSIIATYRLVSDDLNVVNVWDMLIASYRVIGASTDILAGSTNSLVDVGGSLNPVFDGGALTLVNGDSSSLNFTVNNGGATISSPTAGSATLSGVFSGTGAMTFNGSGTTYMNGANTYSGGTTVSSGTLSVGSSELYNTARLAGDVTVDSGATLAGHGGVGGNVTNSGTVKPGGSIGTLTVSGNYVQSAAANLTTTINPSANSLLAVAGSATLDGSFTIDAESGTYTKKKYTILTSSGLSGQFSSVSSGNLSSYTSLGYYLSYDANNVYLTLTPSAVETQAAMTSNAYGLRGAFNLQSAIINNGLSYDCTTFDVKGICVSAGGRYTSTDGPSANTSGALLITSYRATENMRIGAYLDQNLSSANKTGVHLSDGNPMGGVFGVWNQNTDGTGYEVRLAAGYSDKDVKVTRSVIGTSEAGTGDTSLQTQAYSATISRGFRINNASWIVNPYLGLRYTKIKRDGYAEVLTTDVQTPLTYAALSQETTTALAGIRLNGRFGDKTALMASIGVENDINHNSADYLASGLDGLAPMAFNSNVKHVRPVAAAGISYAIDKRQAVGAQAIYRQEAFQSSGSASGMVTYQVGF